ncbi:MAG: ribonuclease H family protein [Saprospiraceae bacterium]|nr:ribonuclease H family protein [Saprospiraceae bacterium]
MAKSKPKFYVVWVGRQTGIFKTWAECQKQISGFEGAKYKSFKSEAEAKEAFSGMHHDYIGAGASKKKTTISPTSGGTNIPNWKSIAVDAACSGNPGWMEYQGVDTSTGKRLFHQGPFAEGTNNVGEFLALVHGLAYLKQKGSDIPIYTDSKIAMAWIRAKKHNSKLTKTVRNKKLFILVERAEKWLRENSYSTTILKWATKEWGEIPADFGRK